MTRRRKSRKGKFADNETDKMKRRFKLVERLIGKSTKTSRCENVGASRDENVGAQEEQHTMDISDDLEMIDDYESDYEYISDNENIATKEPPNDSLQMVLIYAAFILKHNLTFTAATDLDHLISSISGSEKSAASTMEKLLEEEYRKLLIHEFKMCPSCYEPCSGSCSSKKCHMYRVKDQNKKGECYVKVKVFDILQQIKVILNESIQDIQRERRQIFNKTSNRPVGFCEHVETKEEFLNGEYKLSLVIGFDEFTPHDFSSKQHNMFYAKLIDVPSFSKCDPHIMVGAQMSRTKIGCSGYQKITNAIVEQLARLENGVEMSVGGQKLSVKVTVVYGVCDFLALRDAFDLKIWTDCNGCPRCFIVAEKSGRFVRFCGNDSAAWKTCEFYNQYKKRVGMLCLLSPNEFISDRLHIICEGILKYILVDFHSSKPTWPSRCLMKKCLELLERSLKNFKDYTYASVQLIALKEFRMKTASQVEKLSMIVLPLVCAEKMINCPYTILHLFGVAILLLNLSNKSLIGMCAKIGKYLGTIHEIMCTSFTIKSHFFYVHLPHDIARFGYRSCSSDWVEKLHHDIQMAQPLSVSNTDNNTFKRFLMKRFVRSQLADSEQCSSGTTQNTPKTVEMPQCVYDCFGDYFICNMNKITFIESTSTNGYKYHTTSYTRTRVTDAYRAVYQDDGETYYGEIEAIYIETRQTVDSFKDYVFFVISRWRVENVAEEVLKSLKFDSQNRRLNNVSQLLLQSLKTFSPLILKIIKSDVRPLDIIPATNVISPYVDLKFSDNHYLFPMRTHNEY